MKASELRIGNLVSNMYEKTARVREIHEHPSWAGGFLVITNKNKSAIATLRPIPLTAEWFEKCGGRIGGEQVLFIPMPEIKAELHFEMKPYGNFVVLKSDFGELVPEDIVYVHQLQNLYFALTGEELTIKEDTK